MGIKYQSRGKGESFDTIVEYDGDITAQWGREEESGSIGLLMEQCEKGEVGRKITEEELTIGKGNRVILDFNNTESIDIVIKWLKNIKRVMENEK